MQWFILTQTRSIVDFNQNHPNLYKPYHSLTGWDILFHYPLNLKLNVNLHVINTHLILVTTHCSFQEQFDEFKVIYVLFSFCVWGHGNEICLEFDVFFRRIFCRGDHGGKNEMWDGIRIPDRVGDRIEIGNRVEIEERIGIKDRIGKEDRAGIEDKLK